MPNIAYLILTHGAPYQTIDLLWSIWREEDYYFVHLDRNSSAVATAALNAIASANRNIYIVPSDICSWGTFSLVAATLRCIDLAVAANDSWSHAVLVSGTHIPLKSAKALSESLEPDRSYMTYHDIDLESANVDPPNWFTNIAKRFVYKHYEVLGLGDTRGGIRQPPAGVTFFWGSQWLILSRRVSELMAETRYGSLALYLRNCGIPDESYFQTMLGNSLFKREMTHRQIIWQQWGSDGRPRILTEDEFRVALSSKQFFARKASAQLMRDPTGLLQKKVATLDRLTWTKSVITAFRRGIPPGLVDAACSRYLGGMTKLEGPGGESELISSILLRETAELIRQKAFAYGLAVQISSFPQTSQGPLLICKFPEALTIASYYLVARFCGVEVAWIGICLRSHDLGNAALDLTGFEPTQAFDLSLPPVRGLHSFHDLLKVNLRLKGVVYLGARGAEAKLSNAIERFILLLTTIPGMVPTGDVQDLSDSEPQTETADEIL